MRFALTILALLATLGSAFGAGGTDILPPSATVETPPWSLGLFEAVVGVTTRAQSLTVSEESGGRRLAVMTSRFVPSPTLTLRTPIKPFTGAFEQNEREVFGYYLKVTYNPFTMDRQEDPDTGGIGTASPVHDYGTEVNGHFLAVAPVMVVERLQEHGALRLELGMGLGYLALDGTAALQETSDPDLLVVRSMRHSGLAFHLFCAGQWAWRSLILGAEMGVAATSFQHPYAFNEGYVAVDLGYRWLF